MIVIVLPAFNEQDSIAILIQNIILLSKKRLDEEIKIVVVDDGSSDSTADRVDEIASNDVVLIRHEKNKGLGEALKTGLLYGLNLSPEVDVIVTMDSDNTHTPGLLMRMIMALDEGNDLVIASRYRPGSRVKGLSLYRQLLSVGMSYLFRLIFPISGVRDYSCGYRAYKADLLRKAFLKWDNSFISQSGFGCMVDILLKLDRLGAIMTEVPLILRYDYKHGKSKMKVIKTIRETIKLGIHEKIARIRKEDI
jgi:dolichol-phosphate mannosyltransferase